MSKKILILGGFGFIGTNLIEELLNRDNYELIIFEANKVIIQNPSLLEHVKVYYGDFHNEKDYEIIFKENDIDTVIHLISTTIPSISNDNIIYDIQSNLINTIKLLTMMKQYVIKNIVFSSSGGTVYGISDKKHNETDPTTPICSYGIVKLAIEKYLYLFNHLYGMNYLIVRSSNPFGEYHTRSQQGLINVVLENICNGEKLQIWGDGSIVRDYIYVKDLVRILADLIEKEIKNEIINIGSGRGFSINEILALVKEVVGEFPLEYTKERKLDVPYLVLNVEKLKSYIQFDNRSLKEGIKKTYDWLKKNR